MTKAIDSLLEDIREIESLIERCRREGGDDPDDRYALALLEQCLERRLERLRRELH